MILAKTINHINCILFFPLFLLLGFYGCYKLNSCLDLITVYFSTDHAKLRKIRSGTHIVVSSSSIIQSG